MIDLHVHLAGSLKPATIIEYAKERNVPLPTYNASELESYLEAPDHCTDTAEFYELCDMTDWVLQERRSIRRAMTEMVRELDAQGVMYAEIRFSPSECTLGGLRQGDAVSAALEGLTRGIQESRRIRRCLFLYQTVTFLYIFEIQLVILAAFSQLLNTLLKIPLTNKAPQNTNACILRRLEYSTPCFPAASSAV